MEHKQLLFFSSHTTTLLAYTEYKICVKSCIAFVKILFESSHDLHIYPEDDCYFSWVVMLIQPSLVNLSLVASYSFQVGIFFSTSSQKNFKQLLSLLPTL